jgi:hypothetical protein
VPYRVFLNFLGVIDIFEYKRVEKLKKAVLAGKVVMALGVYRGVCAAKLVDLTRIAKRTFHVLFGHYERRRNFMVFEH